MDERCCNICLSSLRCSFITSNNSVDRIVDTIGISATNDMEMYFFIKERVEKITVQQLTLIVKTIVNNELYYSTSADVFNLQQAALSIKRTSASDGGKNAVTDGINNLFDATYHIVDGSFFDSNKLLVSGHTYVVNRMPYCILSST